MSRPIYQAAEASYRADTCARLAQSAKNGQLDFNALVHGHYPGRRLAASNLRGLKTVGFWDADRDQDWGLDWHRNEGIEWTLLESGHVDFAIEGNQHTLIAGDLTVTRPWQTHRVGNPNITASRLHWLILDVDVRRPHQSWRWPSWILLSKRDLDELTDILRHNERPILSTNAKMVRCFQRMAVAVKSDHDGSSVSKLSILINETLLSTLELLRGADLTLDHSLSDSVRTVELFLSDLKHDSEKLSQPWTVKNLARQCGLGVTQFTAHCKHLTNLSPLQYLNHLRLDAAASILSQQPDLSVTDIAFQCGFASSQYFATAFRRHFGQSPRRYRDSKAARKRGRG